MKTERLAKRVLDPLSSPRARRALIAARDQATGTVAWATSKTGSERAAPGFIVIGAQKGGTTFLFQELLAHPEVHSSLTKELHYFDDHYAKGHDWYLGHFPSVNRGGVAGEASPSYLFHPYAADRVARDLPNTTKAIAVLRNPVARAFSHWRHERRLGFEPIESFREALEAEESRTTADLARMADDPHFVSFAWRHFTYRARGHYVEQVDRWQRALGPDRLLVLDSTELYRHTEAALHLVHDFLGLDRFTPDAVGGNDMAASDDEVLDPLLAEELRLYFEPWNQRLLDSHGVGGSW
ncbi:MAG: sulfotransferase domain-containing protein [Actinomycetota bacterium]